ncbi:MAG: hypothetical protein JSR99_09740 [Proteobacteria bacterium]|nr:hypothetical protein [Pseudomonadota bacterium]
MATILEFKSTPRPTDASVMAVYGAAQSAEIVFFPGIRYEHTGEPEVQPASPKRRRDEPQLED